MTHGPGPIITTVGKTRSVSSFTTERRASVKPNFRYLSSRVRPSPLLFYPLDKVVESTHMQEEVQYYFRCRIFCLTYAAAPPRIKKAHPLSGPTSGDTLVIISGSRFFPHNQSVPLCLSFECVHALTHVPVSVCFSVCMFVSAASQCWCHAGNRCSASGARWSP